MADRWKIKFHVWPYFGVKREPQSYSQPHQGTKYPEVEVTAATFSDALEAATNVLTGIRLDERVHAADIDAIVKVGE